MDDKSAGIVIYAVAVVVALVVTRWFFRKPRNRGRSVGHSMIVNNPEERISTLQEMFPHLSTISIRDALERANFVVDDAISFLLAFSSAQTHAESTGAEEQIAATSYPTRCVKDVVLDDGLQLRDLNKWSEDPVERQKILALKKKLFIENSKKQFSLSH